MSFVPAHRRGFTLIELMVSIALIVFLLIGINQVFKMTGDAIGAGQQVAEQVRDTRAAAAALAQDSANWVTDSPVFCIRMELDANGNRRDTISFFTRGSYQRQPTASPIASTSSEAYIWIGHRWQPSGTADRRNIVCRFAMLLKSPAPNTEPFVPRVASNPPNLTPLIFPVVAADSTLHKVSNVQTNPQLDLGDTSIELFRSDIAAVQAFYGPSFDGMRSNWWRPLLGRYDCDPVLRRGSSPQWVIMGAAAAIPDFVENVSQLIIEYTGDFLTQDANGAVISPMPDGVPDFVVVPRPDPRRPGSYVSTRQTRWYGLPRSISGYSPSPDVRFDVQPLICFLDLYRMPGMTFEREYTAPDRNGCNGRYTCVWVNSAPAMVRMLMKVDDPGGRIQEGTWYEFILGPQ